MANVYLHYVLDEWFAGEVQQRLRGPSTLVRYCDDFVMLFAYRDDAQRVLAVLAKRLGKYGLQLHPDKTQLVDFRFGADVPHGDAGERLATRFNFLGFTHVWGRSRKGKVVVRQLTAKDRFARTLKAIDQQCRQMRHRRVREQHQRLCLMLTGHYAYFGITGNLPRLKRMYCAVARGWRKWLSRRSNDGPLSWEQFQRVLALVPLPRPRIVHGYA